MQPIDSAFKLQNLLLQKITITFSHTSTFYFTQTQLLLIVLDDGLVLVERGYTEEEARKS